MVAFLGTAIFFVTGVFAVFCGNVGLFIFFSFGVAALSAERFFLSAGLVTALDSTAIFFEEPAFLNGMVVFAVFLANVNRFRVAKLIKTMCKSNTIIESL